MCLIEIQPIGAHHRCVGDPLIAGGQAHKVSDHDVVDRHALVYAVAQHKRIRTMVASRTTINCATHSNARIAQRLGSALVAMLEIIGLLAR